MTRVLWTSPRQMGDTAVVVGYRLQVDGTAGSRHAALTGTAEPEMVVVVQSGRARGWRIDGSRCEPAELRLRWAELDRILLELGA